MKSYRIGNDIHFEWTIRGLEEVTGTKVVQLYHANRSVPEEITYTISGNVASGVYRGKHQTEKGAYRLLLQVNNGADGMVTLDKVNAWALFGVCAFGIVAGEDDDAIQTVSVELESDLRTGTAPGSSVQADWDETDPDDPAYIKHKPTIPDAQIQSDFNQTNTSAKDFIKNKPNMAAIQQWLAQTVCGGAYNSTLKRLEFKDKDNTLLFTIDATAFIKDGMVTNVEISNGNLVITFNTDSGQEPISIPITNIFNPNNYYTKNDIDLTFATIASIADMATKTWVNNQGYLTSAPVTSVNGQTGAVSLTIPDVSGKAEKNEMSVVDGTGTDSDKTTITLKTGTSATVLKSHQDISGKADKVSGATNGNFAGLDSNGNLTDSGSKASDFETVTTIEAPVDQTDPTDPITTLTCEVGKYYRIAVAIETLSVTLPAMTDTTHLKTITLFLTGGTTPAITFASATSGVNAYKAKGFTVESGKTYEISCLWNGVSWIVTQVEIELS